MSAFKFVKDLRKFENTNANKALDRLVYAYAYKAPESRAHFFWNGDSKRIGIADICQKYFPKDEGVMEIFMKARRSANNGVFQY